MEVNGSRGRLGKKTSKEKSVKKEIPNRKKKDIAGSVKPGKPPARKYGFIRLSAPAQRNSEKEKSSEIP